MRIRTEHFFGDIQAVYVRENNNNSWDVIGISYGHEVVLIENQSRHRAKIIFEYILSESGISKADFVLIPD